MASDKSLNEYFEKWPSHRGPSSELTGKQLANRVSNTSEEMAEYAWRYALTRINQKAHVRQ